MSKIGVTGLGTMGAALALNIADSGFDVAIHNRSADKVDDLMARAGDLAQRMTPTKSLEDFVAALDAPRAVLLMVPAGGPVDAVIEQLIPLLDQGDMIIDGGNADFNETRRREADLSDKGFKFFGMGVSGGEEGARYGPSIMVGGPADSYERVRDVVEAIAAKYEGDPCAAQLGPDGAGHFVKTVHNGIEYADMQLIAEVYGILRADGRPLPEMATLFDGWNKGALQSYLIEITAEILATKDNLSDAPLLDVIVDRAGQKGTGRWTVIEALKLGESPTVIDAAVAVRSWSAQKDMRIAAEDLYPAGPGQPSGLSDKDLEDALLAARIIAYSQGLSLLAAASDHFDWSVDLGRTAEIWRAGCIIRSALLDDIASAARDGMPFGQLILSDAFVSRLDALIPALRRVVVAAAGNGLPATAFASALSAFDTMRQARGSANMLQAQRDRFGRHGFERTDRDGNGFHGPWAD